MKFRVVAMGVLLGAATAAVGQAQTASTAQTPLARFLSHFDLGVSAAGFLNGSVSGTTQNTTVSQPPSLNQSASSTVGVLATLRAQKSPYVGGEFNFGYGRTTQTFNFTYPANTSVPVDQQTLDFRAQAASNEFTLGYVAKPPHPIFGAQPFIGGGAGSIEFKPTKNGGDNLPVQARAAYYYALGVEAPIAGSFGYRLGFRQVFYLAPDFGQNYLKIKKLTSTYEPTIGFYYHF